MAHRSRNRPSFCKVRHKTHLYIGLWIWLVAAFTLVCVLTTPAFGKTYPNNLRFTRIAGGQETNLGFLNAIFHDSEGYIWLGGKNGLLRYDGYRFDEVMPYGPGIKKITDVSAIFEDSQGQLWIGTRPGIVLYDRSSGQYKFVNNQQYVTSIAELTPGVLIVGTLSGLYTFSTSLHQELDSSSITFRESITEYGTFESFDLGIPGIVWAATESGLVKIDWSTKEKTLFKHNPDDKYSISSNFVRDVLSDSEGKIWVATKSGLNMLDTSNMRFKRYYHDPHNENSVGEDYIEELYLDSEQYLWIGTDSGGLSLYNEEQDNFIRYRHNPSNPNSLSSDVVRTISEDNSGDIWVGNYPKGINFLNRSSLDVSIIRHDPLKSNSLSRNNVEGIIQDSQGNFWLGIDGGGINHFDRKSGKFTRYHNEPGNQNSISKDSVLTVYKDSRNRIWIGTWSGGVNLFINESKQFLRFPFSDHNSLGIRDTTEIGNPNVWSILEDSKGIFWFGTHNGLFKYNELENTYRQYRPNPETPNSLPNKIIWVTYEDSAENFWIGTAHGLAKMDRRDETFISYLHDDENPNSIAGRMIYAIMEDRRGRVWFGTSNGLNLWNPSTDTFSLVDRSSGLANESIHSIVEDSSGLLWLGTDSGISSYNPENKVITNYQNSSILPSGKMNIGAALFSKDNMLVFGGIQGFTIFNSNILSKNPIPPKIAFTDLKIFTQSIRVGDDSKILTSNINHTDIVTLNHNENMFSFEFAALSYRSPRMNQYAYKLEGFDENWRHVGNQRTATYTNLDAGKYIFKIKASNEDGLWNNEGRTVHVVITSPPWRSWWAYSIYLLILLSAIVYFYINIRKSLALQKEKQINADLIRSDKIKESIFAHTSHELRTPLNGIVGIAESLIQELVQVDPKKAEKLNIIVSCGRRLTSLINNILDRAKISGQGIDLHKRVFELHEFVNRTIAILAPIASDKEINITNSIPPDYEYISADEDRLQQIFINLIGNAIKYSDDGDINISASLTENYFEICVSDQGIGIPEEKINNLYTAFHQLDSTNFRSAGGTGLGLVVTKELIEAHDATIHVDSKVGVGTNFRVHFPVDVLRKTKEDYHTPKKNLAMGEKFRDRTLQPIMVLITDDDPVNRLVLRALLEKADYKVIEANSGEKCLHSLTDNNVDLVILDVMMPGMDGFETCEKIRETFSKEALPVLFLTANNADSDIELCKNSGGDPDMFLKKPIVNQVLLEAVQAALNPNPAKKLA